MPRLGRPNRFPTRPPPRAGPEGMPSAFTAALALARVLAFAGVLVSLAAALALAPVLALAGVLRARGSGHRGAGRGCRCCGGRGCTGAGRGGVPASRDTDNDSRDCSCDEAFGQSHDVRPFLQWI